MSKYIEIDTALLKTVTAGKMSAKALWRRIMQQPSIDICFCRECKHWNEEDHWCNIRDSYGWDYKPDDFCSYGVRKGADDED